MWPIQISFLILASCSTLKKSMLSGALIGGVVGGSGGAIFSPDPMSRDKNAYLGGVIGAVAGAGLAYLFHDGPEKKMKAPMLLDEPAQIHKEVPLFDFSPELKHIRPEVNFKPVKKLSISIILSHAY